MEQLVQKSWAKTRFTDVCVSIEGMRHLDAIPALLAPPADVHLEYPSHFPQLSREHVGQFMGKVQQLGQDASLRYVQKRRSIGVSDETAKREKSNENSCIGSVLFTKD
ncbi:hypothetical protein KIPB_006312 [Kipferlia bialata]|uniref:Uncharacterized protein n=1 Tax=Kipferlia bialata TaxID=797122 RepID=A0A9K3CYS9_9EUKA|nr:hypothetical protein KIPB_006312 [Kipferlia bialata]|eukprot:g6312.t1